MGIDLLGDLWLIDSQWTLLDAGCMGENNCSMVDNQPLMARRVEIVIVQTEVSKLVEQWI